MTHSIRLDNGPFTKVKAGTKTVELRLYDEKRKKLKAGDFIEFTNRKDLEKLTVKILELHRYDSFEELYTHYDKVSMGYEKDEEANPKDMEKYYSKQMQDENGVVAIEIKKV